MNSIFSRKSASGASTLPSSIVLAFALGPPFLAVKAVAGEQHGQPHGRFAGGSPAARFVAPDLKRFQPRAGPSSRRARAATCGGRICVIAHSRFTGSRSAS